ncbi:MAG: DUF3418 domain-containing protein [Mesorhizobium sp.]
MPPPRAESDAFRDTVLARVVNDAYALDDEARPLPRTKAEFEQLFSAGLARLPGVFDTLQRLIASADAELQSTERALENATKQARARAAVADIRVQLQQLFPPDLLLHVELARLEQYPRYLRAAQARLMRAVNDPSKDSAKAAPFVPVWQAFLDKQAKLTDRAAARRVLDLLEELRVALFAPELKPAQAVTLSTANVAVQALR